MKKYFQAPIESLKGRQLKSLARSTVHRLRMMYSHKGSRRRERRNSSREQSQESGGRSLAKMRAQYSSQSHEYLDGAKKQPRRVVTDGEIFEDSLRVTRASFHPKETNAEYYAMQSKMKKYRKIGDTFVNIKMDDSYH